VKSIRRNFLQQKGGSFISMKRSHLEKNEGILSLHLKSGRELTPMKIGIISPTYKSPPPSCDLQTS
jgi:hypothetical protein